MVVDIESQIRLYLKGTSDVGNIITGFERVNSSINQNLSIWNKMKSTYADLSKKMKRGFKEISAGYLEMDEFQEILKKNVKQIKLASNSVELMGKNLGVSAKKVRWFKMEWLGIMFFAQNASKYLFNLLRPAAELVGIFDIFNVVLQVLFLDTMLWALENVLLPFMDFIMNLSPELKNGIGSIILASAAFLGFLGVLASIILVVGSLEHVFATSTLAATIGIMGMWVAALGFVAAMSYAVGGWENLVKGVIGGLSTLIIRGVTFLYDFFVGSILKGIDYILGKLGKAANALGASDVANVLFELQEGVNNVNNTIPDLLYNLNDWIYKELKLGEYAETSGKKIINMNDLIGTSYVNTGIKAEASFKRIADAYGTLFSMQVKMAALQNNTAAGMLKSLGYTGYSPGITLAQSSYANVRAAMGKGSIAQDFVWRPGEAPLAFSPDDTLIATKKGGGMNGVVINQTIHVTASNRDEINKLINDNNKRLVEDIKRVVAG